MTRLLVGTKKGLFIYHHIEDGWSYSGPFFEGCHVSQAQLNPHDGTIWAAIDTGHWGCKLHRSSDDGITWQEIKAPEYPEGEWVKEGRPANLTYIWTFEFAIDGSILLGTSPGGLFKSTDNGQSWQLNRGLWDFPERMEKWFAGGQGNMGAALHNIITNGNSIIVAISAAGVFQSDDAGETWRATNTGQISYFLSDYRAEVGHDPHCIDRCDADHNRIWMQNHCGIYRSDDAGETWIHVSEGVEEFDEKDPYSGMGNAFQGFPIHAHPELPDTAWVIPMKSDEYRVAPNHQVMVCRTDDAGKTWRECSNGLPSDSYDLVLRHASDLNHPQLAMGSTTGSLWYSADEGDSFTTISRNLPPIHSVRFA